MTPSVSEDQRLDRYRRSKSRQSLAPLVNASDGDRDANLIAIINECEHQNGSGDKEDGQEECVEHDTDSMQSAPCKGKCMMIFLLC